MCLQLGLLTYYSGLLTIEVALTHAAVYKVSLYFAHNFVNQMNLVIVTNMFS